MRNGTRVLALVAAVVGVLVGAVLLLVPARSDPTPGPVAEIVIGESADAPTAVVETPPGATAVPEVVEPPAPLVGDDDDDLDDGPDDDGPDDGPDDDDD